MFEYPCMCGKSKMNFKFDIKGPFTGECCTIANLEKTLSRDPQDDPIFDEGLTNVQEILDKNQESKEEDIQDILNQNHTVDVTEIEIPDAIEPLEDMET